MQMWGGWNVGPGAMMAPPYSMPMMIMPGANMQPPQYGWAGQLQQQQQQQLAQQQQKPPPLPDPNPPGTMVPPPPPPDDPSSAKPLFPGVLSGGRPPPPPGGPNLSAPPPPPPPSEPETPKPPTPAATLASKSGPSSSSGARNLERLSAPPPPPPPSDEDVQRGQSDSRWGRIDASSGSGGQRENLNGSAGDGGPYYGEGSEYGGGYAGGSSWNGTGGGTRDQSRWAEYGGGAGEGSWNGGKSNIQDGNSSDLSPGTWRCDGCQEVNFASRVECKRCGLLEVKERMNKLKNFDKMFESWTENYNKWKVSNENNPDKDYVTNYTAQMEAMRHQLLDKRKMIFEGDPLLKPKATSGKRVMEEEALEQQRGQQVKRSRWEQDTDLDIEAWRRPKQSEEDFWKPKAVKDYSQQQGPPRRAEQEFRPSETFDYSRRDVNGRGWGGENWGPSRTPAGPGTGPWGPSASGMENRGFNRSSESPSSTNFQRGGGSPRGRPVPGPPPKPVGSQVRVDSLVQLPGRLSRPPRLAVILRGLPGAGKSHVAKLLKEKETEQGADAPRTMALDDYFECDGEYEYEAEMEPAYRGSLEKSFKKNVDGGLFPFLIVDAINEKVDHFRGMWSHAKQNGFEVELFWKWYFNSTFNPGVCL